MLTHQISRAPAPRDHSLDRGPTGLALVAVPATVVRLFLGAEISGAAIPLGRLAGVALLALGMACWLASSDEQARAARAVVSAMLVYNVGAVVVLTTSGLQSNPPGILLWPAVILHAGMAAWCASGLLKKPQRSTQH